MKHLILTLFILGLFIILSTSFIIDNRLNIYQQETIDNVQTFGNLSPEDKKEAIKAYLNGSCNYNGIKLKGKVKIVDNFEDIKVKFVSNFADIHVKFVSSSANECGEWQEVSSFEDFKIKIVNSFEDLKVKKVNNFPGMQ